MPENISASGPSDLFPIVPMEMRDEMTEEKVKEGLKADTPPRKPPASYEKSRIPDANRWIESRGLINQLCDVLRKVTRG